MQDGRAMTNQGVEVYYLVGQWMIRQNNHGTTNKRRNNNGKYDETKETDIIVLDLASSSISARHLNPDYWAITST